MQLSQLPVFVGSVIVIEPVCAIRRLLYLGYEESFAQGVHPSGRQVVDVTVLWVFHMQLLLQMARCSIFGYHLFRHHLVETVDYLGPFLRLHHIPHLALPPSHASLLRQLVVGVHLYRKLVAGVYHLYQQREVVAVVLIVLLAYEVTHVYLQQFRQVVLRQRTVSHHRLVVFQSRQNPHLTAVGQRRVVEP